MRKFRLEINYVKTKIQTIADPCQISDHVQVMGNQVELVHGFSYLGCHIGADGGDLKLGRA